MARNHMQLFHSIFGVSRLKAGLPVAAALLMGWSGAQPAQAALSFNAAGSSIVYKHDLDNSVGGIDVTSANLVPALPGFPGLVFNSTRSSGTLNSTARAGAGHITNAIQGSIVFQSGTLLNQADPNNLTNGFSTLDIEFTLRWNNTGTLFGAPILTSFNLPVMASVGTGGEASVTVNINWNSTLKGTLGTFNQTQTFTTPGVQLATILSSGVVIPPLAPLAPGDSLVITGKVTFKAKNAEEPTSIGISPIDSAFHINTFDNDGDPENDNVPSTSHDASPLRGTDNGSYLGGEGGSPSLTENSVSGLAVEFNGQNVIYTEDVSDFNHDFTISLYFNATELPFGDEQYEYTGYANLLTLGSEGSGEKISLYISSDGALFFDVISYSQELFVGVNTYDLPEFNAGDEMWHHVLATSQYDEQTNETLLSLFVDGELAGTANFFGAFFSIDDLDMVLGADFDFFVSESFVVPTQEPYFYNYYNGLLDELFIMDFAVDPTTQAPFIGLLVNDPNYDPNNPVAQNIAAVGEPGQDGRGDGTIPEPSTTLLALLSMAAIGARRLSRNRSRTVA